MSTLGVKILAAKAVGELARRAGRGGGTSLPGKVLMRLDPHAIAELGGRLERGSLVMSATNGKTTTAAMAASILEADGLQLVHNAAGANMAGGVASTLLAAARAGGRIAGELGLFEVDEFWLDRIVPELSPRSLLLSNLFRDQLDRYGELETIAERWAGVVKTVPASSQLVLNADDPLVADLGRERAARTGDLLRGRGPGRGAAGDAARLRLQALPSLRRRVRLRRDLPRPSRPLPLPELRAATAGSRRCGARRIELDGTRAGELHASHPQGAAAVALPLPGLYNVYNALAAAALCRARSASRSTRSSTAWRRVTAAFGRAETDRDRRRASCRSC